MIIVVSGSGPKGAAMHQTTKPAARPESRDIQRDAPFESHS
jgi:hypothetical protein